VGIGLSIFVLLTTTISHPPKYMAVVLFVGFILNCTWIFKIANEIIGILEIVSFITSIPKAIVGLTILAWGNSLGDLVANVAVARRGYAKMAVAACFGGPLLNVLLGIGVAFIYKHISNQKTNTSMNPALLVNFVFLMFTLISSVIIIPLSGFKAGKKFGIFLIVTYIVCIITAIIVAVNNLDTNDLIHFIAPAACN